MSDGYKNITMNWDSNVCTYVNAFCIENKKRKQKKTPKTPNEKQIKVDIIQ